MFLFSDLRISTPEFTSDKSHVVLPMLTDAYSDLQLSVEFKPERSDGILLLTGETSDMSGDYLALLLRDGYAELRLDCGTGPGLVRSSERVRLNHWNRLTVFRHDWGVWLQLNNGQHDEGRSQGLFSRITFAQPVVLGSPGSYFSNTKRTLETEQGFRGCVRNLEINNKVYCFDSAFHGGDATAGVDIGECSSNEPMLSCPCQNNGFCSFKTSTETYCQCPLGFYGDNCQMPVDVQVPSFDGTSHAVFNGIANHLIWNEIEVVLKPAALDGLYFYIGDETDFLALYLRQGFAVFEFNAGDGATAVQSRSPLKLGKWHTVRVSRTGLLAEIKVDRQRRITKIGQGAFTQVSLGHQHLYLGGLPSFEQASKDLPIVSSFQGCIQKVSLRN